MRKREKKGQKKKKKKKRKRRPELEEEGQGRAALLAAAVVGGLITIPILLAAIFGPEEPAVDIPTIPIEQALRQPTKTAKVTKSPRRLPGVPQSKGPAQSVTPIAQGCGSSRQR